MTFYLRNGDLTLNVLIPIAEAVGAISELVKVIFKPPAKLSNGEVIVEAGCLVEGVSVHLLDLHLCLVASVVPEGVDQNPVAFLKVVIAVS